MKRLLEDLERVEVNLYTMDMVPIEEPVIVAAKEAINLGFRIDKETVIEMWIGGYRCEVIIVGEEFKLIVDTNAMLRPPSNK